MASGGKRKNAGRKQGSKGKKTIERELELESLRQGIMQHTQKILESALNSACGSTVMFQRKKVKNKKTGKYERTGEFVKVSDENRVHKLLEGGGKGEDWYFITTKDANVIAIKELWDRAFGKSQDSLDITTGGKPLPIPKDLGDIINKAYPNGKKGN